MSRPEPGTCPGTPALLVLADGAVLRGRGRRRRSPTTGSSTGEAVFNTVLSGYQEVITDPSYAGQVIAFTYPHIGNYGVNPTDDEAAAPHCRGRDRPRPGRRPVAAGARPGRSRTSWSRHGVPGHHRRRHPPAHPPPARPRRPCPAPSAPPPSPTCVAAAAAAPPTDGRDLVSTVDHRRPVTSGDTAPTGWWPTTSGSKRPCSASSATWPRSPWCRPRPRPTPVLGLEPDGVFLSNGPGDPAALPGDHRRDPPAGRATGRCRSSGSASATSCWPPPSAPPTYKLPVRPPRREPPGPAHWPPVGWRSPRRTTTTRWPPTRSGPTEVTHVNLNDGVIEGLRQHRMPRRSACSTTPRPDPAPTTPATCSRSSGC